VGGRASEGEKGVARVGEKDRGWGEKKGGGRRDGKGRIGGKDRVRRRCTRGEGGGGRGRGEEEWRLLKEGRPSTSPSLRSTNFFGEKGGPGGVPKRKENMQEKVLKGWGGHLGAGAERLGLRGEREGGKRTPYKSNDIKEPGTENEKGSARQEVNAPRRRTSWKKKKNHSLPLRRRKKEKKRGEILWTTEWTDELRQKGKFSLLNI